MPISKLSKEVLSNITFNSYISVCGLSDQQILTIVIFMWFLIHVVILSRLPKTRCHRHWLI